jgi:tetratricopeptide (TPR) repeat protein
VFQGLSVFRGGFTADAAQVVAGASLRGLRVLVNKSLIGSDRTGRYDIHELLRQYAHEILDESPATAKEVRDRHCAYYADALERWAKDLKGARQQLALEEMRADSENARAAWDWAAERAQVDSLGRAAEGLCLFYDRRGRLLEGEAACQSAADRLAAIAPSQRHAAAQSEAIRLRVLARVLIWQTYFTNFTGRRDCARQLLRRSSNLLDEPILADQDTRAEEAQLSALMSKIAEARGEWEEAKRLEQHALELYRSLGDKWATATWLTGSATTFLSEGALAEAQHIAEEGLALRQSLGDQWGVANALSVLSEIAREKGDLEESKHLARESIAIRDRIGHRGIEYGSAHLTLAETYIQGGEFAEAHTVSQETRSLCEDLGLRSLFVWSDHALGYSKLHLGQYEAARSLASELLASSRRSGPIWGLMNSLSVLGRLAAARQTYDEARRFFLERVDHHRNTGQRTKLGGAVADLGLAARGSGNLGQARRHLCEALGLGLEIRHIWTLVDAFPPAALLLSDKGEAERAVELYVLASHYPYVANSRWFEDVAGNHIAAAAATLPPEVVSAAQQRGRARDLWETAEELLEELEGKADDA